MTDTHRCIAGSACRRGEYVDDERQGALTEKPDTLCPTCTKSIEDAIRQLPRDWRELRAALGERTPTIGQNVRSTPTPAMPISARKNALMSDIVEAADRAAGIVAERLNTEQPSESPAPPAKAARHSLAYRMADEARIAHEHALKADIALIEPNIELLATAPADAQNVWHKFGETREIVEMSGIDVALELADLHHQARAELGKTRLRERFGMPCPRCGAEVGRDDGTTIVDCKKCESSWTEREYKFLVGLITKERLDMEILKWLLAEAYWRLDKLRDNMDLIKAEVGDDVLDLPGAGRVVADAIAAAVDGHKTPAERAIVTDRKSTEKRQHDDDNWAWRNETPYRPPKRKPPPPARAVSDPIHPSSLSTLIDVDEDAVINGDARCKECNLIHAGSCA